MPLHVISNLMMILTEIMGELIRESKGGGGGSGENSNFLNLHCKISKNMPRTPPPPLKKNDGSAHEAMYNMFKETHRE